MTRVVVWCCAVFLLVLFIAGKHYLTKIAKKIMKVCREEVSTILGTVRGGGGGWNNISILFFLCLLVAAVNVCTEEGN